MKADILPLDLRKALGRCGGIGIVPTRECFDFHRLALSLALPDVIGVSSALSADRWLTCRCRA